MAVLATVYLVSSGVGAVLRGAVGVLGTAANVTASGASDSAPKIGEVANEQLSKSGTSFDDIKREAMAVLQQTGKPELQPGAVEQQAKGAAADASAKALSRAMLLGFLALALGGIAAGCGGSPGQRRALIA